MLEFSNDGHTNVDSTNIISNINFSYIFPLKEKSNTAIILTINII